MARGGFIVGSWPWAGITGLAGFDVVMASGLAVAMPIAAYLPRLASPDQLMPSWRITLRLTSAMRTRRFTCWLPGTVSWFSSDWPVAMYSRAVRVARSASAAVATMPLTTSPLGCVITWT